MKGNINNGLKKTDRLIIKMAPDLLCLYIYIAFQHLQFMHSTLHRKQIQTLLFSLLIMITLPAAAEDNSITEPLIRLATTTSTENSGLLNHLLPVFHSASGYKVHVIAVGTGKALRMGKDGDVDVVLVHAPEAEASFVDAGYGDHRHAVMYNDFVVVGPVNDPAKIGSAANITAVMKRLAAAQSLFISRGDDSGTHKKENQLWKTAGIKAGNSWLREAGQGMGKVLQIATELDAYTLTDRGTWLAYRDKSTLKILFEGDEALHNPYGIIAVSARRYPDINRTGALALIKWIRSKEAQQLIGDYRIDETPLFTPSANSDQIAASQESADNHR